MPTKPKLCPHCRRPTNKCTTWSTEPHGVRYYECYKAQVAHLKRRNRALVKAGNLALYDFDEAYQVVRALWEKAKRV